MKPQTKENMCTKPQVGTHVQIKKNVGGLTPCTSNKGFPLKPVGVFPQITGYGESGEFPSQSETTDK